MKERKGRLFPAPDPGSPCLVIFGPTERKVGTDLQSMSRRAVGDAGLAVPDPGVEMGTPSELDRSLDSARSSPSPKTTTPAKRSITSALLLVTLSGSATLLNPSCQY